MAHQVANKADITERLAKAGDRLVIVKFFDSKKMYKREIADLPTFDDLPKEFPGADFLAADINKCPEVFTEHKINVCPTFVVFKDKVPVEAVEVDIEQLKENMQELRKAIASFLV